MQEVKSASERDIEIENNNTILCFTGRIKMASCSTHTLSVTVIVLSLQMLSTTLPLTAVLEGGEERGVVVADEGCEEAGVEQFVVAPKVWNGTVLHLRVHPRVAHGHALPWQRTRTKGGLEFWVQKGGFCTVCSFDKEEEEGRAKLYCMFNGRPAMASHRNERGFEVVG